MHTKDFQPLYASDTVDIQASWTAEAAKTLCAFLNGCGGTLYLGVTDNGVVGIENNDLERLLTEIKDFSRNGLNPSAESLIRTRFYEVDGQITVVVTAIAGSQPPYSTEDADGQWKAYTRRHAANFEITEAERCELNAAADHRNWEEKPFRNQTLTFELSRQVFDKYGRSLTQEKYRQLGIVDENGFFTNLAWLLSDQCTAQTTLTRYAGSTAKTENVFRLTGSVLQQIEEAQRILFDKPDGRIEPTNLDHAGMRRELPEYPPQALRSALVNAFVHRDFSLGLEAYVHVFDERIECFAFGGLPKGVSLDNLVEGASPCRNRKFADILVRLGLLDGYGLGFPRLMAEYKAYGMAPLIKADDKRIWVRLPNSTNIPFDLTTDPGRICGYLQIHGKSSRAAIQAAMGWSMGKTTYLLNSLVNQKIVERIGTGRNTVYRLKA